MLSLRWDLNMQLLMFESTESLYDMRNRMRK